MNNPFTTLGVPNDLLLRELHSGEFGRLRVVAKGFYLALSKVYHPDRGGDAAIMAPLTIAFEDIQKAADEELEYYIEELFDEGTLLQEENRDRQANDYAERGTTIRRLLSMAGAIDQFAITGITAPQSLLCNFEGNDFEQILLDVQSPQQTVAYIAAAFSIPNPDLYSSDRVFEKGKWVDRILDGDKIISRHPVRLSSPMNVSIIGRAKDNRPDGGLVSSVDYRAIETRATAVQIAWIDPLSAWFLPRLGASVDGGFVLVDARGKYVAITGVMETQSGKKN